MQKQVTITFTLDELRQVITECIQGNSQNVTMESDIMNQREAAAFLDVTETTIIKYKREGLIPYEQLPGSTRIRYYKSQLKKVLANNVHLLQASRT